MALNGKLGDFNVLQLLALIQKTGKTGALIIKHWGRTSTVFFENGMLSRVEDRTAGLSLALLQAGIIDQELFDSLPQEASEMELAEYLSTRGVLPGAELEQFAREQMLRTLHDLLVWTDGTFAMELNVGPREGSFTLAVDVMTALSGARSRVAEFRKLAATIPSLDASLTLIPEPSLPDELRLTADEWALVARMATPAPLRDLAQRLGVDELAIRKLVDNLISGGLAELSVSSELSTGSVAGVTPITATNPQPGDPRRATEPNHLQTDPSGLSRHK